MRNTFLYEWFKRQRFVLNSKWPISAPFSNNMQGLAAEGAKLKDSRILLFEGLNGGGGGGSTCRLSVKIFDLCQLSVNLS